MLIWYDRSKRGQKELGPPPEDPLARASWLHHLLAHELYELTRDVSLDDKTRRNEIHRYAKALNSATPHHEMAAVKEALEQRQAREERQKSSLSGETEELSSGPVSGAGRLRAAPTKARRRR